MWSGEKDNFISSQKLAQACVKTASQRTRGPGRTTAQDRRKRPDSFACERPRDQYSSLSAGQGWAAEPTRGRATERSTQHSRRETPSRPALPGQRLGPRTVGPAQPETSRGLGGQDKYFRSGNTSLLVWQIPRTKLVFYLQPLSLLPTRTLLSEAGARCVSQGSGQSRRDRGAAEVDARSPSWRNSLWSHSPCGKPGARGQIPGPHAAPVHDGRGRPCTVDRRSPRGRPEDEGGRGSQNVGRAQLRGRKDRGRTRRWTLDAETRWPRPTALTVTGHAPVPAGLACNRPGRALRGPGPPRPDAQTQPSGVLVAARASHTRSTLPTTVLAPPPRLVTCRES